jgi:ATP-dependent RNA helicase DeaD
VHRIGRTGRAGAEGVAITLVEPRERPLLRNIERFTRQRIELRPLPTVADLRARRLELTRASLREALLRGGTDGARVVVEALASEFDVMDIATAAVHLIQEASERDGGSETSEETAAKVIVPDVGTTRPEKARAARPAAARPATPPAARTGAGKPVRGKPPNRAAGPGLPETFTRVYVSAGRAAGVRPTDLVGALTAGAGIPREAIGGIELDDRFSLVEVREGDADAVVDALRRVKIRGREVTASRYRPPRTKRS